MQHSFEYLQRGKEGAEGSIIDFEKTIQAFLDFENKKESLTIFFTNINSS